MEKTQNKTLRLNTWPVSNKDYFNQLQNKDRRSLTDFLCILRDHGVKEIHVRGSSLYKPSSYNPLNKRSEYNDIDLLLTSASGEISLSDFFWALADLSKNGITIKRAFEDVEQRYMGTFIQDRVEFSFKGTNFDIARNKLSIDSLFITDNKEDKRGYF